MQDTLAVILAGGMGSRLSPLTDDRAKPAVPFGGKYRIIDFTLTNCLHSGLRRILVLTQYKSHSLHKHLRNGWSIFNPELGEFITVVPPQMRKGGNGTKEPPMRCFTICGYLRVVMPNTSWCFLVITSIAWIMLPCSKNTSAKMPL